MSSFVKDCNKLGFGLMRLPRLEDKSIDIEQSKQMVDDFIAAGGKYFDTAYIYGGSEEATKLALCDRYPRESYYLASKLNCGESFCKSLEEAKNQIRVTLERTGAGYIDFYLLHGLEKNNLSRYEEFGLWDYVKELKAEGLIRHYGFSFHDSAETLDGILNRHPDAEFVQLQINYADWEDPKVQSRACYEVAVKHDKPVVVMEPVKGGLLANPPEAVAKVLKEANPNVSYASWAVRFVASLDQVAVVLSGMSNIEQMQDNLSYMKDFQPLSKEEQAVIEKAREILTGIDKIPCTGCKYCTPGCPMEIQIPGIFTLMNEYKLYGDLARAKADYGWRAGKVKASACVECGQCESACPQHLHIIDYLKEVVETLEK